MKPETMTNVQLENAIWAIEARAMRERCMSEESEGRFVRFTLGQTCAQLSSAYLSLVSERDARKRAGTWE